jgi:hypothetical protein
MTRSASSNRRCPGPSRGLWDLPPATSSLPISSGGTDFPSWPTSASQPGAGTAHRSAGQPERQRRETCAGENNPGTRSTFAVQALDLRRRVPDLAGEVLTLSNIASWSMHLATDHLRLANGQIAGISPALAQDTVLIVMEAQDAAMEAISIGRATRAEQVPAAGMDGLPGHASGTRRRPGTHQGDRSPRPGSRRCARHAPRRRTRVVETNRGHTTSLRPPPAIQSGPAGSRSCYQPGATQPVLRYLMAPSWHRSLPGNQSRRPGQQRWVRLRSGVAIRRNRAWLPPGVASCRTGTSGCRESDPR